MSTCENYQPIPKFDFVDEPHDPRISVEGVARLQKVKQCITAEADYFGMAEWCGTNECGTTHCIGGWLVKLADPHVFTGPFYLGIVAVATTARQLLGWNSPCMLKLFYVYSWPIDLFERYREGLYQLSVRTDREARHAARVGLAATACEAIDRFINQYGPQS